MARQRQHIDPDRLIDAADAVLRSLPGDAPAPGVERLLAAVESDLGPERLRAFSDSEIAESVAFLRRLGVLPSAGSTP